MVYSVEIRICFLSLFPLSLPSIISDNSLLFLIFLLFLGLSVSPHGPLLGQRKLDSTTGKYGPYEWQTYLEVSGRINRFGSGMTKLYQEAMGLAVDEPLPQQWSFGLWAINRPEWTIASEAGSVFSLVSVGLYDTLGPEAVVYGVNHSECSMVVTSG